MEKEVKLFDKRFVYFMWDDELEGKAGFFSDEICGLIELVNGADNAIKNCVHSGNIDQPFQSAKGIYAYRFFYYDPNYEVKRAYYKEGKKVQVKKIDSFADWVDCYGPPWRKDCLYRIKPEEKKVGVGGRKQICGNCYGYNPKSVCELCRHKDGAACAEWRPKQTCGNCTTRRRSKMTDIEYRPFKDCDELVEFWTKKYQTVLRPANTRPLIWVRLKCDGRERLIVAFGTDFVEIGNKAKAVPLQKLFEDYEFLDGSPVGMVVKEKELYGT